MKLQKATLISSIAALALTSGLAFGQSAGRTGTWGAGAINTKTASWGYSTKRDDADIAKTFAEQDCASYAAKKGGKAEDCNSVAIDGGIVAAVACFKSASNENDVVSVGLGTSDKSASEAMKAARAQAGADRPGRHCKARGLFHAIRGQL